MATYVDALVRPIAEAQLATFEANGRGELMADYFEPISALALARSLGLGDVDMPTLRRWFHGLSQGAINFEQDPGRQAISDATCAEVDAAVVPLLERLAKAPDHSPLSHLLHHGMPEGECRPLERILPTLKVTLLGGMQEPGHGAGSVLVGLLQSEEQMRAVRADMDGLLPKAVNEGLRWVAPIGTQTRNARVEVELGGVRIPAGAPVAAVLASACHDQEQFRDPGRFDIHREEGSHAAFGFGHHFCAGRWFSTAQMQIALRVLLERLPRLALDPAHKVEFRGWEFRAPVALRVLF